VNRAMQAGARGYVLKDAPSTEIIGAIQAISAGQTYLSPAIAGRLLRSQTPRPMLSHREAEILGCLAKGQSSKQIAKTLELSTRTVRTSGASSIWPVRPNSSSTPSSAAASTATPELGGARGPRCVLPPSGQTRCAVCCSGV